MSALTAHDRWLESSVADDDTQAYDVAREREAEAIRDDPERLLEAVYEAGNDEAEKLAKLRIVLADAKPAITRLFYGDLFGDITLIRANMDALRALVWAADEQALYVDARVRAAAEDAA